MKKFNNKILAIILVSLAAIFVLSRVYRASSRESNIRSELVNIDTAAVTEMRLYPNAEKNKEIRVVREGKNWTVKIDNRTATAEAGSAISALNYFVHLKPLRLISKKKNKWNEFHVGDTSTQVKLMKGNEVLADVRIGKIGFNQQPGQQQFSPGSVFTYVRLSSENEVYSVEGFLESVYNRAYNDWRNKSFLRLQQNHISKITFSYPADSGFVLEKKNKKWQVDNTEADSMKVKNFLSQLENKNATTFADDFSPAGRAQAAIQIFGETGTQTTVQAWKRADDWVLTSSYQPAIYFSSKGLESVMGRKKDFLPEKKK
ncbi:MAG: DUF4340 domain-containing protein [Bacteroidetes bacterium]|nr:DUF4340 domain-containing protein [Bacteroidota bacterium]MBS1540389.1 DUF4340 domain-containing protein [Bacteroidota bacterium]